MEVNYSELMVENSLPDDIALKIASLLQVLDVCALGCCSRFWRELCSSECLWLCLCTQRWPSLGLSWASSIPELQQTETHENSELNLMGWKGFYIRRHNEMAGKVVSIIKNVELCSSSLFCSSSSPNFLELRDYQRAIDDLWSMKLEFGDVHMFLFNPNLNVFVNLIGLSYCKNYLEVPAEQVIKALQSCKISDRHVCVKWWKLGRWFYGFRMRDESHSSWISLGDLAANKDKVLGVIHRGAIHEVLRIQISSANPVCAPWSCESTQKQG
ncbi:F-box domain [Dillenia turbinata]|uniref:F-box domain n=1 Tax=Dillenia turbinata TaxID=194707 RepID=A0AAN8VHN1_9MAGN